MADTEQARSCSTADPSANQNAEVDEYFDMSDTEQAEACSMVNSGANQNGEVTEPSASKTAAASSPDPNMDVREPYASPTVAEPCSSDQSRGTGGYTEPIVESDNPTVESAKELLAPASKRATAKVAAKRKGPRAKVLKRWEQDFSVMNDSIHYMLRNRLADAEKILQEASQEIATRNFDFEAGDHDMRGCFAFVSAIMSLLNGLASLENNQLETVLKRVWTADELLTLDHDWAGKTILRGLCLMLAGVVELAQKELTKGVWHILRSWTFLRNLESEALNYQGHERECVRSTALFALGLFNLIKSMLPPTAMRTASWITGFQGGRDVAVEQLRKCWEEGGIQAGFAGLVLIGVAVDVSSFLGELREERQVKHREARRVLDWAAEHHPDSFFFDGLEAAYLAAEQDLPGAVAKLDHIGKVVSNLPAFTFLVHVRMATFQASRFHWSEAARSFQHAVEVHRQVGRRALCPTLALHAHLCHVAAGESEAAEEMLELCLSYAKEKKKWDVVDTRSMRQAKIARRASQARSQLEVQENSASSNIKLDAEQVAAAKSTDSSGPLECSGESTETWRPMLLLYLKICVVWRAVNYMAKDQAIKFVQMIRDELDACHQSDADNRCMALCIQAEAMRQMESWDEAMQAASAGIELAPNLSMQCAKEGYVQFCYLVMAYAHYAKGNVTAAKDTLARLEGLGKDHALTKNVDFKATHLGQLVGAEIRHSFTEVRVAARNKVRYVVDIPESTDKVEWDWVLDEFTIDFVASFRCRTEIVGKDGATKRGLGPPTCIQQIRQHEADAGPITGSTLPTEPGQLELIFDNSFSILRPKQVQFRVEPACLKPRCTDR